MTKARVPSPLSGRPLPLELTRPLSPFPRQAIQAIVFGMDDEVRQVGRKLALDVRAQEWLGRLITLYVHYGIDPGEPSAPHKLLVAVLRDFIVGFNEPGAVGNVKRGRPKGSHKLNRLELYLAVRKIVEAGKKTHLEACQDLTRSRKSVWYKESATALDKQYMRFCKELQAFRDGCGPDPVVEDLRELSLRSNG